MKEKESLKKIKVFTESGSIETTDIDSSPLENYSKVLSGILESSNVSILETTEGHLILRPSKITGILVTEEKSARESKKLPKVEKEDILMEED